MKRIWPLPLVLLSASAFGQVEFYQNVERNTVGTDDTFELNIVVGNAPDDAQLKTPEFKDFDVLSRSSGTQMQFQMGGGGSQFRKQTTHTLVLQARRSGVLLIPPAVLKTKERDYKTDAIRMEVKDGQTTPRNSGRGGGRNSPFGNFPFPPGFDDFFGDMRMPGEDIEPGAENDVFLVTELDSAEAYVGEQMTFSAYILSRVPLASVDSMTHPKFDGFWTEDLESPSQLAERELVKEGVRYRLYLVRRRALFPTQARQVTISPSAADIVLGRGFSGKVLRRTSDELTVQIKPLPEGAPAGFLTQNVGQWKMGVEFPKKTARIGEPLTARIWVEGQGNFKNLALPGLPVIPGLKVFSPTTSETVKREGNLWGGRRVMEYLLMPQQEGSVVIPSVSFSFFNPTTAQYETIESEPISLQISKGEGLEDASAGEKKNDLKFNALRPLRIRMDTEKRAPLWKTPLFWTLFLLPLVLGAAWIMASRLGGLRSGATTRGAKDSVLKAQAALRTGNSQIFFVELEKALLESCEKVLNASVAGLTHDEVLERLRDNGVSTETVNRVAEILRKIQEGRFAPIPPAGTLETLWAHAQKAMEALKS